MSKNKIFYKWNVPKTVEDIVRAICADYDRRAIAIQSMSEDSLIKNKYKEINLLIDSAIEDIEAPIRRVMLEDIFNGRGYDRSPASYMISRRPYYARKHKIIHDIALKLNLISE